MLKEYTDAERFVLQMKFANGDKLFLNGAMYMGVSNPYNATRYPPVEGIESRQESRDKDVKWMSECVEAEISFVPYLEALAEYRKTAEVDE